MKLILLLSLSFFCGFNIFGQTESDNSEVAVEQILLARDDGSGEIGEETTTFSATDIPIHCSVELNSTKSVAVKMNFVIVEAGGLKREKTVVTISYKTNGKQNVVNFNASPGDVWTVGKYRADVLLDGKLAKSRDFEIQKPSSKNAADNISSKPKTILKKSRKLKKN